MNFSNKSVLLVDDNENLLSAMARVFEDHGFLVHTAISSAEAMVFLNHRHFDVIISDNQMVGINGTRLLAYASRNYPQTLLFMLTGDISPSQLVLLEREIGICQIFEKPCKSEVILEAVVTACSVTTG